MCTSFKRDILNSIHAFGVPPVRASATPDTFKGALFLTTGSLGAGTTAYSGTDEVSGAGYTAGGNAFTFGTPPSVSGTSGIVSPSANLVFSGVTLTTPFDTVLMYNDTQPGKPSVSVYTFGAQTVTGTFVISVPANAPGTAMIEIA
jgi:hypothetical protein